MLNYISKKLQYIQIGSFIDHNIQPITVNSTDVLSTVVKTLTVNKIHSCPVIKEEVCIGVIDMMDIMKFIISIYPSKESTEEYSQETLRKVIGLQTAENVLGDTNFFFPVDLKDNCNMLVKLFCNNIHRSPVFNKNEIVSTVSQSDIIMWLYNESTSFMKKLPIFDKTLAELGLGLSNVVVVKNNDSLIHCLKGIDRCKVSALPVVNDRGYIVGNFSVTDLKGLYLEKLPDLISK